MDLSQRLGEVTVVGAAGKMGSGIALLLALELTYRKLASGPEGPPFLLHLVDTNPDALRSLYDYIRTQSVKAAEKNIVRLRRLYANREDLVENGDIIQQFASDVGRRLDTSTDLSIARSSAFVFEAIAENEDIKLSVYRKLRELCPPDTFFLTNTSSIPIAFLDEHAALEGRIIGCHFYNPPAVQKLVELITCKTTRPELIETTRELGKVLRKTLIPSNDVTGFIGNGHFSRDGLHGLAELARLQSEGLSFPEAVYALNRVSQEFLVRPMGIFQLIDYVGIDVFKCILDVMSRFLPGEVLHNGTVNELVAAGVRGGQYPDGSQKNGLLQYDKGAIVGVYDPASKSYLALDRREGGWTAKLDSRFGAPPAGWMPWKKWVARPDRDVTIPPYLASLWACESPGCKVARRWLVRSAAIARGLVRDGVAAKDDDVNGVLLNGFFHAYGPINAVTLDHLESETGEVSP